MDEEAFNLHKRHFTEFLDPDVGKGVNTTLINDMISHKSGRLIFSQDELRKHNPELASAFLKAPNEYIDAFASALKSVVSATNPTYTPSTCSDFYVGATGDFGSHHVTPRSLGSEFVGQLVCVDGIATKCSTIQAKVVRSVHHCAETGVVISRQYRDSTAARGLPTGAAYPTEDDNGNRLTTQFGLSTYINNQTVTMQEMPERSPPGQLPRSVDLVFEEDLVDSCKPGDRLRVVGIYQALPSKNGAVSNGIFRTIVRAISVTRLEREATAPTLSENDLSHIKEMSKKAGIFSLLANSLAPSIKGHEIVKKALLLLLLGGVERNLANGTHLRGDINILMVGDPSVAKSQLLRFVLNSAPLAVSTTGRGSSGVGLTAAVTYDTDTKERRLEAGAMVLADRGVVCIDEFDKMNDADRVAIHEVMEQQTVTIAKAGIHTSLNARCSVVAAANPVCGSYNKHKKPTENIGLQDSLLSRFDLLFIMLDQIDSKLDKDIADHVIRMHRYRPAGIQPGAPPPEPDTLYVEPKPKENDEAMYVKHDAILHGGPRGGRSKEDKNFTVSFVKKYIYFAKARFQPQMTPEARELISEVYTELRQNRTNEDTMPVTARTLETIIRLSSAHAKAHLRKQVLKSDVKVAVKILRSALEFRTAEDVQAASDDDEETTATTPSRRKAGATASPSKRARTDTVASPSKGTPKKSPKKAATPVKAQKQTTEEVDVDFSTIAADRVAAFEQAYAAFMTDKELSHATVEEILEAINPLAAVVYSVGEAIAILKHMEADNKVMYREGIVHLI